jgi:hypothetical protein
MLAAVNLVSSGRVSVSSSKSGALSGKVSASYLYIQPNALYYLKLKNYLQYIALIQYKLSLEDTPEDGARQAPKHVG